MTNERQPIVVDVDTGIDDAYGLLYLCAQDGLEIVGISSVCGNVGLEAATRNTRAVMALAGRAEVPVWPGASAPLADPPGDASIVHGVSGLGYAELPEPPLGPPSADAVEGIVAAARAHRGELILVATGPLTNIALAIMREPQLPRLVKRLVIMGGAFLEAGNVTPTAEFNIWHDPEAARVVFRAFRGEGVAPMIAVGLDVTHKTLIKQHDLDLLGDRCAGQPRGAALMRFLSDSARYYFELMERWRGGRFLVMHDPLAVAVAIDPTLVETRRSAVDVELSGALTRGMTVADWRGQWNKAPNVDVAIRVDAERFRNAFLAAIERLAGR